MLNKILDLVTGILKDENKFTPKNSYEAYIKGKFSVNPNYNTFKTSYTKFNNYILSDLFRLVIINSWKGIKYLFTLLDITTRWLNFYLLKIKIKSEALKVFKKIKIVMEN